MYLANEMRNKYETTTDLNFEKCSIIKFQTTSLST